MLETIKSMLNNVEDKSCNEQTLEDLIDDFDSLSKDDLIFLIDHIDGFVYWNCVRRENNKLA